MEQTERSIAILIDGENIAPKYINLIIDEANKHGKLNYKRIYGDWTNSQLKKWKEKCLKHAFTPIQQFTSSSGKNSSDFSLVIDAMDILNKGKANGFCIVSSDGDFSRLIVRLKEDDVFVFGMGEEKTPISLVNSYESFTYLDKLYKVTQAEIEPKKKTNTVTKKKTKTQDKKKKDTSIPSEKNIINYVKLVIDKESEDDGWIMWSKVANLLKKKYPGFNPANYGKNIKKLQYFKQKTQFSTKIESKVNYLRNK